MILVADASVLVAELLRERGRKLLRRPDLQLLIAEEQWRETEHELQRRLTVLVARRVLDRDRRKQLESVVDALVDAGAIEVVPRDTYAHLKTTALRRVPRDERDWPTVALSIALGVGILTADNDFLGCGCPTWTVDTLLAELGDR